MSQNKFHYNLSLEISGYKQIMEWCGAARLKSLGPTKWRKIEIDGYMKSYSQRCGVLVSSRVSRRNMLSSAEYTTGSSLPIDPRLGTTPVAPASLQLASITGYSGRVPVYDTAVRFPKERRSLRWFYEKYGGGLQGVTGKKHIIHKRQTNCACVPAGTCPANGSGNFGNGLIDVRIVTPVQCGAGLEYCCTGTTPAPNPSTPVACGQRQTVPAPVVRPSAGQADFGEYPWMVMVLTKQNDYIAGGVLIDSLNVLTVVHRLTPYIVSGTAPNVKVRLGEWDAAGTYEPVPFQEYTIAKVFTHPSFNSGTLQYDIAVLRLATAVPFTPAAGAAVTINRACLPPSAATAYTGQRCWVSGWGKDMFGQSGQYQAILKEVEVPIVNPATCQASLRTARLGANFILDTTSFICAGGEVQRDSCTGDGGSPLVCQVNGQWVAVGLVSWGLGCAASGVPGVYVNLAANLPWIQQQVATQ